MKEANSAMLSSMETRAQSRPSLDAVEMNRLPNFTHAVSEFDSADHQYGQWITVQSSIPSPLVIIELLARYVSPGVPEIELEPRDFWRLKSDPVILGDMLEPEETLATIVSSCGITAWGLSTLTRYFRVLIIII